ncbi:MAG: hypothetical protein HQL39_17210 [Alphaproteobacteria bacterium]|nr:hypothetical protein [Alphaproteobacteria bacterium]
MDANGLVDTGLTPEQLAALDPALRKTLLTAWELVRTQRSTFPIAMEFLHAYLTKTTPNPIPPWQMRRSMDFVDAVDRMRRRITAVLERCAEAAERVGTRTAYLDSVESIMGGDQTSQGRPVEYVANYDDWDLFGALGTFNIQVVRLSLSLFKTQDKWTASGQADFEYHDRFDFDQHDNMFNQVIRDGETMAAGFSSAFSSRDVSWITFFDLVSNAIDGIGAGRGFTIGALDALEKAGLAKSFDVRGSWTEMDFPVGPVMGVR